MMRRMVAVAIAAGALALAAPRAYGQIDYRNLDEGRPVTTEDAYPVERYGFELLLPYRFEAEHAGADLHTSAIELEYGAWPNTQIGVKTLLAAINQSGETDWGLGGIRVFSLYNFNTESGGLPALALRAEAAIPAGNLAGDAFGLALEGIGTHSWGATRAHVNAGFRLGTDSSLGLVDAPPRWLLSGAVDHTLLRQSLLVVAEVLAERPTSETPVEVNFSAGLRWQWQPTLVLDAGLTRRLSTHGSDFGLTIGLSHAFAIRSIMPGGAR
jgi:hypothetical protein